MKPPDTTVFLNRPVYRLRRLGDAARLLPILGTVLFLLPILWSGSGRTAGGLVYLMLAWLFLIALSALLSRKLDGRADVEMPVTPVSQAREL